MAKILTTDRLVLREMVQTDADDLLSIFEDDEAMRYYPSRKSRDETIDWIHWTIENYEKYGVGLWIVEDKTSGQFLGQCGLVLQKIKGAVEVEIGYLFARQHWGNGYATEAALACKMYGFQTLGLKKVISLIDPLNKPSIRVASRIGMSYERAIVKRGKALDLYACYEVGNERV